MRNKEVTDKLTVEDAAKALRRCKGTHYAVLRAKLVEEHGGAFVTNALAKAEELKANDERTNRRKDGAGGISSKRNKARNSEPGRKAKSKFAGKPNKVRSARSF